MRGTASIRHGLRWASFPREMRPARSRTLRCFEIAGWLIAKGAASSKTEASPLARRLRIARRVGSASAAKVALSRSGDCVPKLIGSITDRSVSYTHLVERLEHAEMSALVARLMRCKNPMHCPHGRPTMVRIEPDAVARMFKRT